MRRLALLVTATAALSACHYAGSPVVGFGGFIADTHTFANNPNLPPGASENIQRVKGQPVPIQPLLAEPGNIWPGPPKPEPTLEDMIREEQSGSNGTLPAPDQGGPAVPPASAAHPQPRPIAPGSSEPPPTQPQSPAAPAAQTPPPMSNAAPIRVPPPTVNTPSGPQAINPSNGGGITTTTSPAGTSIIVPNGNGTSTVIGPDGTTRTIPTPK